MYFVGEEEIKALTDVVLSQKYFRYQGANQETLTSQCETDWAQFLNAPYTLLNTSGTNSLVIGLASFGIGPGDEVIIPSYTFIATASAVMQVGAIPIIANIDNSLTLDLDDLNSKITKRTKAIIAVHMDGLVCDMERILELCHSKGILLVEDAAQACGGTYKGRALGTLGSCGAFSFNMDKVISCGEGGLLVIGDKSNKENFLRAIATHDTPCRYGQTLKDKLKDTPPRFGLSTRLNEINSAMLKVQLKRLPGILKKLRKNKREIVEYAKELGLQVLLAHDDEGDIGSNLHINCTDPIKAIETSKVFLERKIKASPPFLRPGHACWQWFKGMTKEHYYVDGLNPYNLTAQNYTYRKQDFLPTVKTLSEVIRIELSFLDDPEAKESLKGALKEIAD